MADIPVEQRDDEGRWRTDIDVWGAQVPAVVAPQDDPPVERQSSTERQFNNRSSKRGS